MFLPILFLFSNVQGKGVLVGGVQSTIEVTYDGKTTRFDTMRSNLKEALTERGFSTYEQDQFSISKDTPLYGQELKVSVGKSLPIVIYDDQKKIVGRASSEDPLEILAQNGIEVYPQDIVTADLVLDPVKDQAVGQRVRVQRAPVFTVFVDGGEQTIRSWARTIKEVLAGNVSLGARDIVEPELAQPAIPGTIKITRINIVEVEEELPVPYKTVYKDDYFVPRGQERVVESGANGTKKRLVRVRYKNGVEEQRTVLSETVVEAPTSKVIKKGLMPSGEWDFRRDYWNMMVAAGTKYGVSPLDLFNVASCESHLHANSIGAGKYYGLYQYNLGLWQKQSAAAGFAGVSWSDPKAQIYTTARYVSLYGWGPWGCKP